MLSTFGFTSMTLLKAAFLIVTLQCVTGSGFGDKVYHLAVSHNYDAPCVGAVHAPEAFCTPCSGTGRVPNGYPCHDCGCTGRTMDFIPFTLNEIREMFKTATYFGDDDQGHTVWKDTKNRAPEESWILVDDYSCFLAQDSRLDGWSIEHYKQITDPKLEQQHKFVHANYYNNGEPCRCGQQHDEWSCTRPLKHPKWEARCKQLQRQMNNHCASSGIDAGSVGAGDKFDDKLHDLKTSITEYRGLDYWNFWKTHTPGVDVY